MSLSLLTAQQVYFAKDFQRYSIKDGLSYNDVTSMAFDSMGYLWIGTVYGLNRFDGEKFKTFIHGEKKDIIPGNYITDVNCTRGNQLNVITRDGLGIMKSESLTFQNIKIKGDINLEPDMNRGYSMKWLNNDLIGISTLAGFYVVNKKGEIHFSYTDFKPEDVGKTRISFAQEIFKISENEFLIYARNNEMFKYHLAENSFKRVTNSENENIKIFSTTPLDWTCKQQWHDNTILYIDRSNSEIRWVDIKKGKTKQTKISKAVANDMYWASYVFPLTDTTFAINCRDNGFYIFLINNETGEIFSNETVQLPEYRCHSIKRSKDGRLFIGTSVGILQEKNNDKYFKTQPINLGFTKNLFITDVIPLTDQLAVSTFTLDVGLLFIHIGDSIPFKTLPLSKTNQRWNQISYMRKINENEIWCSTQAGIAAINTKDYHITYMNKFLHLPEEPMTFSELVENDTIYISSTYGEELLKFNINTKQIENITGPIQKEKISKRKIYYSDGTVWFAGFGLVGYDCKKKVSKVYDLFPNEPSMEYLDIAAKDDILYLSTTTHGLIAYDLKKNIINALAPDDKNLIGIPLSNTITDDQKLTYWQNGNLVKYNIETKEYTSYNFRDGMPEEPSQQHYFRYDTNTKTNYFSTENHIISFKSQNEKEVELPIVVSEIVFRNEKNISHPHSSIKIDYKENSFMMNVTALDYDDNNRNIKYKIDDSPWVNSEQGKISILGLPIGKHVIKLSKAKNPQQMNTSFLIEVLPPFYKTWWFISILLLSSITLFVLYYKNRLKDHKEKIDLNLNIVESEIKALHSQMNPHFMFNCLNTIKSLVLQSKEKEASKYINIFSSLIRNNLEHNKKSTISVKEQVDYLHLYLQMEELRFSSFKYRINVSEDLDIYDQQLPPMILQPLVENAIWHGLQINNQENEVLINIYSKGERIYFEVDDNGVGINQSKLNKDQNSPSIALENIHQRIKLLNQKYDLRYHLTIIDKSEFDHENKGTKVIFSFLTHKES